ncbi:MAG: glycosyltransferase family 2 protein [Anaerolineaceae bacterium]|nr:glycosyltransferase family 2 protein [Anaerolineaceae bacterium]
MKVSLIIPAYNESEGVAQTAASLRSVLEYLRGKYEIEVVFVNDGSKDNTEALLKTEFADLPEVRVVSHAVNRGLGAAIRTGFEHVTGDIIVTTDFDGTYPLNTIPQLLGRMTIDKTDIVTASPYHPQGHVEGVPRYRLMFSAGASLLYRLLVSWRIYTWTALFRAYKRDVIEHITFESDDFLAGTELLVKAMRAGYTVSEFPTTLYVRTFGQSSIKIAKVTMLHLKFQSRLLVATLLGKDLNARPPQSSELAKGRS